MYSSSDVNIKFSYVNINGRYTKRHMFIKFEYKKPNGALRKY